MDPKGKKPKRSPVANPTSLKHGELVELISTVHPRGILGGGTVEGAPWSSSGSDKPDMITLECTLPSGRTKVIDYPLKNAKIYRVSH